MACVCAAWRRLPLLVGIGCPAGDCQPSPAQATLSAVHWVVAPRWPGQEGGARRHVAAVAKRMLERPPGRVRRTQRRGAATSGRAWRVLRARSVVSPTGTGWRAHCARATASPACPRLLFIRPAPRLSGDTPVLVCRRLVQNIGHGSPCRAGAFSYSFCALAQAARVADLNPICHKRSGSCDPALSQHQAWAAQWRARRNVGLVHALWRPRCALARERAAKVGAYGRC